MFEIPVVLILFKRSETLPRIMERLAQVKPVKLYLMSDEGRNELEKEQVAKVRDLAEKCVTWPCELIKNYADKNRGVHENIGMGARWVFEREDKAIFLEDDNLPDLTFFEYCETLLNRYEMDDRVLWVCGTNYLKEYRNQYNHSYMFTKNLLPCGWASWSKKFLEYYDYDLATISSKHDVARIRRDYQILALYRQERESILNEWNRKQNKERYKSWDFHMIYSLHRYGLYGIAPAVNLIENIGVDEYSEHGGSSMNNVMTQRFCEVPTLHLEAELKGPDTLWVDPVFERKIGHIILHPLSMRMSTCAAITLRKIFRIPESVRTKEYFFSLMGVLKR